MRADDVLDDVIEDEGTDIAIVGMSGRFPGASGVADLWTAIRAGRSGVTRFTDEELRAAGVPEDLLADPGYVKAGAVIDGVELFDAGFFGFSPKEAQILDPQHRLFLEHSWEALEDAGCDPTRFDGAIGVFGGSAWSSYLQNNLVPSEIGAVMGELAVGLANDKDSLTTRVSHTLGLSGPSYSVQSYCSTSLVAICAAASSLAAFESDLALAGGVAVGVPHRVGYLYQQGGIAPPDGECRAFDAGGLGAPLGSGVGVVALRRLEDALADGDQIYAVIRGWAVNNDAGRKVGFTAPGVQGQAAVMAEALAAAGLAPADIDYVEAHGTGTALGDAAELAALQQVFQGRNLLIGSVKPNVGHLDRAAGVTNLIKAALALRHGEIPPTRNLSTPNAQLSAGGARLDVVTGLRAWPREAGRIRRAGVSAFGIGGTNAHVVLEEAPPVSRPADTSRPQLLIWSARSAKAADELTAGLAGHLADNPGLRLGDVAHTLQTGRRVFEHRRFLVAATAGEAVAGMRDAGVLGRAESRGDRPVGFLIPGTGEQYPGLAEDLYATEPAFRAALDECRAILRTRMDGADPLEEMLRPRDTRSGGGLGALLGRESAGSDAMPTALLHPALFSVEYALARTLIGWGVTPAVLAGYSLGEYVAACLAGVLSLESALALVAHRATLIDTLPEGAMGAVPLGAADLAARITRAGIAGIDVAAENGPDLTVLAGEPAAMETVRALLAADGIPCRPLATGHAFHSRMMEPVRAELTAWIGANIELSGPRIPYVSNVTGELITEAQATDPGYWAEHMCAPVRFDAVLGTLLAQGDHALVELGPGQSLGAMVRAHRDCPRERWPLVVGTLPAAADPRPAGSVLAEAVGRLWLAGVPIDWPGYRQDRPAAKVGLPTYPFQRERYWIDAPAGRPAEAPRLAADPDHVRLLESRWAAEALPAETRTIGRHVLFADATGVAEALAQSLSADGGEVVTVRAGDSFAEVPGGFTVDPASAADHIALARRLAEDGPVVVADLRLLDPGSGPDGRAVVPLARLLDAFGDEGGESTRVVVATLGGQAVAPGEHADPAQAAAATLPITGNQEYLALDCRGVDLDPRASAAGHADALAAELRGTSADVLVAYRNGRRHVREFVPAAAARDRIGVRPGGTYLITGGLGDVGLLVGEHLIRAGAGRLILTSRSGPRGDAAERLRALGAEVLTPRVDVTDAGAMRTMLAEAGRVDGVVHAAAETGPDTFLPLRDVTEAAVERHFGAKVTGARVLAEVLPEVDFCVLFSSTSSILGGIAFGSYSAANAALTALARKPGWISASWDTWSVTLERLEGGMGAAMVAHSMTAAESLAALDQVIAVGRPAVVVAAGGLADRLPKVAAGPGPAHAAERFPRPELPQPYSPPLTGTERGLAELWSEVLGVEPVGTRDNFFDLGGNSLVALQMLALVKKRFGVAVPTVLLFEAPTVNRLAAILDERGAAAAPAKAAPRPAAPVGATRSDDDRRIAIVGMAGRFPGAGDVDAFWRNLRDGVESISFFTPEELRAAGVDESLIHDPAYVPARPILDDVAGFDAQFFGISPRMAALTDPQQRLFLEVCWEALEHAGYGAPEHRGRVGVYGGANLSTYLLHMGERLLREDEDVSHYEIIMGNDKDALTTTVSYLFDLHGPSVAVQTFCSTSLVATHMAVQSLRAGECEMALAGGVSIRVPDKVGHVFGPGGMESPDGHVRTFDARARGSMFGDGAAVVLLKRLSDAVRDGDHVWAVIRGSAMNNDGALKVGYTAPSVVGQARVIADALADADVTGEDISYVEAHGTATELGDPIEVAALTRAFGPTAETGYCPIGSVKTNVGHLDRAAGASGLIKTSYALTNQVIPASLHYTAPNPEIDFDNSPFYVNAELSPWRTRDGRPRIAGLNSLGMGGTNVHMVIEEAPARPAAVNDEKGRRHQILPVSARNAVAAEEAARRLGDHLGAAHGTRLADAAYTLQVGRKTFEHRKVVVATATADAARILTGEAAQDGLLSRVDTVQGRQTAFLFAGVGEQYPGMVTEIYEREPAFRAALDECLELLRGPLDGVDLPGLMAGGRGAGNDLAVLLGRAENHDGRAATLKRTEIAQPALFAIEYALARTLMSWGLQPRLMLGYSLGEYVAACLAGVLSLPDAIALVAHRAKLIGAMPAGSMVAVSMPAEDVRRRFRLERRGLDLAAVNGPQVSVVAGPSEEMERLVAELRRADIPCRALDTTHAFHSRMLQPVAGELTDWVKANIRLNPPELPYISNLTGELADADLVCDPGYWAAHMCGTVRFGKGVETLLADPELAVVEIGPGQSLGALVRGAGCPPRRWPLILHALPGGSDPRPDDEVLAGCLARLWLVGAELDWNAYHGRLPEAGTAGLPGRIPLPTYPFQRRRYWIEGTSVAAGPKAKPAALDGGNLFDAIAGLPKLPEEQWLHLPVWRQTAAPAPSVDQPRSWLVFTREGAADAVTAELAATGATVIPVRPGEGYAATGDGHTVRPGNVADALALLRDLRAAGRGLDRVLHLWTLEPGEGTVEYGLHTLVALARAAGESGLDGWSLDVVASGTQEVIPGEVRNPDGSTLIGPALVIPLEYPRVTTRFIDVDTPCGLVAELARPQTDRIVALRRGRRHLPGYETMATPDATPLRDGGVYLITGGLGGIALGLAERMARDVKARLVLLARSGLPGRDEAARRVQAVRDLGGEVEIVVGDVSDPAAVRRAVDTAIERFGVLHGVLHAAGLPAMGLMQFKRPPELDAVLAPKIAGTRALAEALRIGEPGEIELDFLALFSSITSATGGGPGQVDYCAANAYLDGYALRLAATGRNVVSIDWGEWTWNAWEAGLAGYDEGLQTFFKENRARVGIGFEEGYRSLLRALASGEPRVIVSTQDFETVVTGSARFNLEAVTSPAVAGAGGDRHPRPELVTPYQEPSGPKEEAIAVIWGDALRLDRIGVLDNFFELGGNSLLGVSIVAALRREFALAELPPHILYEAPTVAALAATVEALASGPAPAPGTAGENGGSHVRAQLRRSGLESAASRRRR
ncbi:SDR family NAD(P)-dependent oxidoreductase [Herbidospora sp. NEAU-GS84]|uniref:SDR family NAD(P)-dependent oxidoreductase n=1 Tax=Herbidospora solisilvae TaxID=2696284 RepID=A0A7C9NKX4_9ACTN|nr:type I polyketide synthase [Herbidospora solisilvae]NAS20976.1 SDR family NAD(P)-dependent oxidoreductase [Herbidospora solisilvae]